MGNSRRRMTVPALWEFGTKMGKSDAPINTVILEPEPRMGVLCRLLT